jgi:rod shape-determining protein MreC
MQEGDLLVTSGTDGVFPRGLPVGKLSGLKRSGQGLYQRADVAPVVDMTKLEEVLIMTSAGGSGGEEPQATAPSGVAAMGTKR